MDVDDEVLGDDLAFVLTNVLWTELHLASFDVVTPLDERSVEHYPEHRFVREASMLKNNLNVTLESHTHLLLLCQEKDHTLLFLVILLLGWVSEYLSDI